MNPTPRRRLSGTRKNFTLIELLVVIAIIAILAGILLPALNSARNKARAIQCVSQLKTFGTCEMSYLNDYNDYCTPPHGKSVGVSNFGQWRYHWDWVFARDYLKCALRPAADGIVKTDSKAKVFWCPSDPSQRSPGAANPPRSYSILMGWGNCYGGHPKASNVKTPSESMFITEHKYTETAYITATIGSAGGSGNSGPAWNINQITSVGTYHPGLRANILLFDGHVASRRFHDANVSYNLGYWDGDTTTTINNFCNKYSLMKNHTY